MKRESWNLARSIPWMLRRILVGIGIGITGLTGIAAAESSATPGPTAATLLQAGSDDANWLLPAKSYAGNRYTALNASTGQVMPADVSNGLGGESAAAVPTKSTGTAPYTQQQVAAGRNPFRLRICRLSSRCRSAPRHVPPNDGVLAHG